MKKGEISGGKVKGVSSYVVKRRLRGKGEQVCEKEERMKSERHRCLEIQ